MKGWQKKSVDVAVDVNGMCSPYTKSHRKTLNSTVLCANEDAEIVKYRNEHMQSDGMDAAVTVVASLFEENSSLANNRYPQLLLNDLSASLACTFFMWAEHENAEHSKSFHLHASSFTFPSFGDGAWATVLNALLLHFCQYKVVIVGFYNSIYFSCMCACNILYVCKAGRSVASLLPAVSALVNCDGILRTVFNDFRYWKMKWGSHRNVHCARYSCLARHNRHTLPQVCRMAFEQSVAAAMSTQNNGDESK